jgi:hypothetical protein
VISVWLGTRIYLYIGELEQAAVEASWSPAIMGQKSTNPLPSGSKKSGRKVRVKGCQIVGFKNPL